MYLVVRCCNKVGKAIDCGRIQTKTRLENIDRWWNMPLLEKSLVLVFETGKTDQTSNMSTNYADWMFQGVRQLISKYNYRERQYYIYGKWMYILSRCFLETIIKLTKDSIYKVYITPTYLRDNNLTDKDNNLHMSSTIKMPDHFPCHIDGSAQERLTPLLTRRSYVFFSLTHQCATRVIHQSFIIFMTFLSVHDAFRSPTTPLGN